LRVKSALSRLQYFRRNLIIRSPKSHPHSHATAGSPMSAGIRLPEGWLLWPDRPRMSRLQWHSQCECCQSTEYKRRVFPKCLRGPFRRPPRQATASSSGAAQHNRQGSADYLISAKNTVTWKALIPSVFERLAGCARYSYCPNYKLARLLRVLNRFKAEKSDLSDPIAGADSALRSSRRSLASQPVPRSAATCLGRRGRAFKSPRPDQVYVIFSFLEAPA